MYYHSIAILDYTVHQTYSSVYAQHNMFQFKNAKNIPCCQFKSVEFTSTIALFILLFSPQQDNMQLQALSFSISLDELNTDPVSLCS